jgi:hypothetical protein
MYGRKCGAKTMLAPPKVTIRGPEWLNMTMEEETRAFGLMGETLVKYGNAIKSFRDLAWCLAFEATRKHRPGRKLEWTVLQRLLLVGQVEDKIKGEPKRTYAVEEACKALVTEAPWFGKVKWQTLYKRYFDSHDLFQRIKGMCGNWQE